MTYYDTISAKDMGRYLLLPKTIIVDLRDEQIYRRGHIPKAINIPDNELAGRIHELHDYNTIIFYCERGNKSLLAARKYQNHSQKILSMYGGIHAYRGELVKDSE